MTEPALVPARMINEIAYCPRLFALEHVAGEWAESAETADGARVHRRVDRPSREGLPEPTESEPGRPRAVRSVDLGDPMLGLVARIDLVEVDGSAVVPIDYNRGDVPDVPEGAWEPERVQVMAQILLLRAHGYQVPHGELWFAGSRRRVRVEGSAELETRVLALRDEGRAIVERGVLPPPLVDSPKCRGCSLAGICLPDEHNHLTGRSVAEVRPLMPARDDGVPLHVQLQGGRLRKDGGELVVEDKGAVVARARFTDTNRVVVYGNASVSTPLLHELADQEIPLALHSYGGWLRGIVVPASGHAVHTRIAQHRAAANPAAALEIARRMVQTKVHNSRVLLRRNARGIPAHALAQLGEHVDLAAVAVDMNVLRGVEGSAARIYFEHLPRMIAEPFAAAFAFDGRNRRPPRDPVNAMLSFAYACLVREFTAIAVGVGLDAWVGFLHVPRAGRPALALDLMEEFRPVVADSAVIGAINNAEIRPEHFVSHPTGTQLTDAGRRGFIEAFERRLDILTTHPRFDTRMSYRRIFEVQVRLLGKAVLGEIPEYPGFKIR